MTRDEKFEAELESYRQKLLKMDWEQMVRVWIEKMNRGPSQLGDLEMAAEEMIALLRAKWHEDKRLYENDQRPRQ